MASLSVVIPAWNEEAYIAAALDSVAMQEGALDAFECIVVDNASTDRTGEVVRAFQAAHPELRLMLAAESVRGAGAAKNRGAKLARGEVLVFLDADSRLAPDVLRAVDLAYRAGHRVGSIPVYADSEDWLETGFFRLMEFGKRRFQIHAQMFYCERALFLQLGGFDPALCLGEDIEFLQRAARAIAADGEKPLRLEGTAIWTSPRRLRRLPLRLGFVVMFARWSLARAGLARRLPY